VTHETALTTGAKLRFAALIGLLVCVVTTTLVLQLGGNVRLLNTMLFRDLFQSMVWEGIPFIVIGVLLTAVMEVGIKSEALAGMLGDHAFGRMIAGLIGLFVPVCDCGAVPVARGLRRKGVAESVAFTFAISAPTVNVMTLVATFFAFHRNWTWVFLRGGSALVIALIAGLIVRVGEEGLTEKVRQTVPDHSQLSMFARVRTVFTHAQDELFSVGPFFAASALLAGLVQGFTPLRAVTVFTHDSLWSIPLLMVLGALLSLCSTADAFVAVGLSTLFSPGAILAFMLAGQMVDLRNLLMMPQVFSRRTVIFGLSVAVIGVLAIAVLTNKVLLPWYV